MQHWLKTAIAGTVVGQVVERDRAIPLRLQYAGDIRSTLETTRKLVLVVRETPLHRGHLKALLAASENGAVILPPMPAFYTMPASVAEIVDQTVARILDQLGLAHTLSSRWGSVTT